MSKPVERVENITGNFTAPERRIGSILRPPPMRRGASLVDVLDLVMSRFRRILLV
jgi:hypothetical protein